MHRLHLPLLLLFLAATPAGAQDTSSDATEEADVSQEDSAAADEVTDEEIEELLGIDDDYTELEDDFDPTEEVRFEQSVPFPTDI